VSTSAHVDPTGVPPPHSTCSEDLPAHVGRRSASEVFAEFIRWTIVQEPALLRMLPADAGRESFLNYYASLPAEGDEAEIRRYVRGMWRGEAGWAARWIARSLDQNGTTRPVRVLDAGCGFGTYALLFARLGATVTAADLRPDRLEVARWRNANLRWLTQNQCSADFARIDVTSQLKGEFDLVWVYNALSHIDPPEVFLEKVRQHLRPGGVLVIGDLNGANPGRVRKLDAVRSNIHETYVAPDGEAHAYAVERPFTPEEMRDLLTSHGLRVVRHELFHGGQGSLPDPLFKTLVEPLQGLIRLGRRWGKRQAVLATRV